MCKGVGNCAVSWPSVCGPGGRYAGHMVGPVVATGVAGFRAWSTSVSGPLRPRTARCPGTGNLILGKNQHSQIGTLVERSTGFVQLLHLPARRDPETVAEAMIAAIKTLPESLRRSLTWDQGSEMSRHARISIDAGIDIYFCDPHSPWQRGSNENTNGLLRQYFPKGTDLSVHSADYLAQVAAELNERPRKRFGWDSPAQVLNRLLSSPTETTVATKP